MHSLAADCCLPIILTAFDMHLYCFMQISRNACVGSRPIALQAPFPCNMCLFVALIAVQIITPSALKGE